MDIAAPWFTVLALPIIGLAVVHALGRWRNARQGREFAAPDLVPHLIRGRAWHRRWVGPALVLAALTSLTVALIQPKWGMSVEDAPPRGRDIVVLLDTSLSMLAEDARPNRLERAKEMVRELVHTLKRDGGHRLALIGFAGRASLRCPPTMDYDLFLLRLEELAVGSISQQGTLIGDAIRQTLDGFAGIDHAYTDIILISDGEDHGSLPLDAAREAAGRQIAIYPIGIGDAVNGAYVPVPNPNTGPELLAYHGRQVKSRLEPAVMMDLAERTGGEALVPGTGPVDLSAIYRDHISDKPRRPRDEAAEERRAHRFQWFIALALLLLGIDAARRAQLGKDDS